MDLNSLVAGFLTLAGASAFITMIINVLKATGKVQDGQAPMIQLILNLVGLVLFAVANIFKFNVGPVDQALGAIAQVAMYILALVTQLGVGKVTHAVLRNLPFIGFSWTTYAKIQAMNKNVRMAS